jgi:hypothetical protein
MTWGLVPSTKADDGDRSISWRSMTRRHSRVLQIEPVLSIAALSYTLTDRLIEQRTPLSAIVQRRRPW